MTEKQRNAEEAPQAVSQEMISPAVGETIWQHDAETLAWVKKMQQHSQHL